MSENEADQLDELYAVYVLWAKYSDGSGVEILRVFDDDNEAKKHKAIIERCQPFMNIHITRAEHFT